MGPPNVGTKCVTHAHGANSIVPDRFQGGESTLLNSYTEQEAATEKAKQEAKAKRTASNLKGRKSKASTPLGTPSSSVKR